MTHFIAKVYTTFYKAETRILPTSYADADEARQAARKLDIDPRNVSTRIDETLFLVASHHVVPAESEDEAERLSHSFVRRPHITTYAETDSEARRRLR